MLARATCRLSWNASEDGISDWAVCLLFEGDEGASCSSLKETTYLVHMEETLQPPGHAQQKERDCMFEYKVTCPEQP